MNKGRKEGRKEGRNVTHLNSASFYKTKQEANYENNLLLDNSHDMNTRGYYIKPKTTIKFEFRGVL